MLIALTGYARAGKDTVGKILVEEHGFHRISFADRLKRFALALDPILEVEPDLDTAPYKASLRHIVDLYGGLEQAKELSAVRSFLQELGTVARDVLGQDVWVDAALSEMASHEHVVITDCRFRNEARHVRSLGGKVVRIVRPGVTPVNLHVSETEMAQEPVHADLLNAGTVEDLSATVRSLLEAWEEEEAA